MQVEKIAIRTKLLEIARSLFFRKGYDAVTMREIAQLTGIGLGSIYTYFKSKEQILKEVLSPFFNNIQSSMRAHFAINKELYSPSFFTTKEGMLASMQRLLNVVDDYQEELRFLFTYGHQTKFCNYFHDLIEYYYKESCLFMQEVGKKDPSLCTDFSKGLLYLMNEMWISMIRIFVCNRDMNKEERYLFLTEYVTFCTAGWDTLMSGNNKISCNCVYETYSNS